MWFKKKKNPILDIRKVGSGFSPQTGYHIKFKNNFIACFRTLEEVNQFIKCSAFREIIKKI